MATINNNPNINSSFFDVGRNVVPCKVKKIILDGSTPEAANFGGYDAIGTIFFTKIKATTETPYTDTDSNEKLELTIFDGVAKPLFPFIKYYPLINEIVPVITLTSKDYLNDRSEGEDNYYFPPINLWNHPHHNTLPSLDNYISSDKLSEIRKNEDYAQAGLLRRTTDGELDYEIPLGDYFNEQLNIKPLRPYEGDHILEGRFGNSIRLGATARSKVIPISQSNNWSAGAKGDIGDPITIISNGHHKETPSYNSITEDINLDKSSAYFTSTQKIPIEVASTNDYLSYTDQTQPPTLPNQYTGEQIILNSGRLLFNTTKDHILLSSKKSINLNAVQSINLETIGPIILESSQVLLGSSLADESAILGDTLISTLQDLLTDMKFAIQTSAAQLGNNGIPLEPQGSAFRSLASSLDFTIQNLNNAKSQIIKVE